MAWESSVTQLRRAIMDTQIRHPDPVPVPPQASPARPVVHMRNMPAFYPAPEATISAMARAPADDPFWRALPQMEAYLRRVYKAYSSGADRGVNWPVVTSVVGQEYLRDLRGKINAAQNALNLDHPGGPWVTSGVNLSVRYTEHVS